MARLISFFDNHGTQRFIRLDGSPGEAGAVRALLPGYPWRLSGDLIGPIGKDKQPQARLLTQTITREGQRRTRS